ncbi:hypothetical protein LNV23_18935 [Paucibacter sp. DJ1R-11]|uniref:hypothetical protein n=1 Tax=Paucibacter sp. DJ1R-11 TaxID=2893556 RepID=UPI0021E5115B|nr:hypothetical protein [Paucibacter sp. DJ1R-11]MCV2365529.1 hypothetical protein [Paucibacter sp. DJ1R-11]
MKFINPVTVTDAVLLSSSVAEPSGSDPALWSAGTAYGRDALVRRPNHRIYKRLAPGTTATAPEDDLSPVSPATEANWKDMLPTNMWAMFDQEVNTQTVATGSLSVTLAPGFANSLVLMELEGAQAVVSETSSAGGPTVYSRTIPLDVSSVTDWYQYFFEPFTQRKTVVLTDLPPYLNARVTVTITGTGEVRCGQCVLGTLYSVGGTQKGATAGVRDYSKNETDPETQVVSLKPGKRRRTLRARLEVPNGAESAIHALLESRLGRNSVWLGDDVGVVDPLVVFGFTEDFELEYQGVAKNYYSFTIQGTT